MVSAHRCSRPVAALFLGVLAGKAAAQSESIVPPPPAILTTTWFYWAVPLFATVIALTIGLRLHRQRVVATAASWPQGDTSFQALCGRAIGVTLIAFAIVMAVFIWVAFSPRTGDEWILHRTVATGSVAAGLTACMVPWLLARKRWDR